MTQTRLRERSKARRKAAIIRAAYELFAERGYDATTVADIAEAAEVAPRTVAMYFPAKQDIALSRFSDGAASLSTALRDKVAPVVLGDAAAAYLSSADESAPGAFISAMNTVIEPMVNVTCSSRMVSRASAGSNR